MADSQKTLERYSCGMPGCNHAAEHVTFTSICHPTSPTWTRYRLSTGTLLVFCSVCGKGIADFKVAAEDPDDKPTDPGTHLLPPTTVVKTRPRWLRRRAKKR